MSVYRTIGPLVFAITAAGVVPCGSPKKFPRTSFIVQIISAPEPRAHGELIVWYSSRRPSVRASISAFTFSKIFFPEEGTNVYINNPGQMTKMAAMSIYGKNPSKIFVSGTGGPISTKHGMKHL